MSHICTAASKLQRQVSTMARAKTTERLCGASESFPSTPDWPPILQGPNIPNSDSRYCHQYSEDGAVGLTANSTTFNMGL